MSNISITVEQDFPVPAEKVFDAWLDKAALQQWMFGPGVRDEKIIHLQINPVVGGTFSFAVQRGEDKIDHVGEYLLIERPDRLSFTWGIAGQPAGNSIVHISIVPTDKGCTLTLTHEMDPRWKEYADRTQQGWSFMLRLLKSSPYISGQ